MGKVRPLNRHKYNISKHRFQELYHFCLQYGEWKDELNYKIDTVGSFKITGMPIHNGNVDATQNLAVRRATLEKNCKIIEESAKEADPAIYPYIVKAVTEELTFKYLKTVMGMPCGKDMYYDRRRKFYWILDQKKL